MGRFFGEIWRLGRL